MNLLIFTPTYVREDKSLAIHDETVSSINDLDIPDGVHVDVKITTNNPYPHTGEARHDHENTLYQYRHARKLTLDGGYDAVLFIEHDMIVPKNALVKMLNTKADVVYGVYLFRHVSPILNACRAVSSRWPDQSLSFFPEIARQAKKQGWIEVSGAGFGCTLIHRRVLEKIDMRRSEIGGHPSPDMPFAADCMRNHFKQIARFDVLCGHIKPDGEVLMPFEKGDKDVINTMKIYVYRTFNANINGRTVHYEEGEIKDMPKECIDDYMRAGFVGYVTEPAVKVVKKPVSKPKKAVK